MYSLLQRHTHPQINYLQLARTDRYMALFDLHNPWVFTAGILGIHTFIYSQISHISSLQSTHFYFLLQLSSTCLDLIQVSLVSHQLLGQVDSNKTHIYPYKLLCCDQNLKSYNQLLKSVLICNPLTVLDFLTYSLVCVVSTKPSRDF